MNADVITFTTQSGSRGEAIAQIVAGRLHFECCSRQLVSLAAAAHGVSVHAINDAERWPDFIERLGKLESATAAVPTLSRR